MTQISLSGVDQAVRLGREGREEMRLLTVNHLEKAEAVEVMGEETEVQEEGVQESRDISDPVAPASAILMWVSH